MALVGSVVAAALVPAAANSQAPSEDSVTGATAAPGSDAFVFDVRSGPSGENASGIVEFITAGGARVPLAVKCLSVTGTKATIGVDVFNIGNFITIWVEDNDGPGADRYALGGPIVVDCSLPPPSPDSLAWQSVTGDLEVVDAQPFPTSEDECKNGGWRNFGSAFKNQGQCVAFVRRGPKH